MSTVAELLTQFALDIGGVAVRFIQRDATGHTHMHLDGNLIADAAGPDMMHLNTSGSFSAIFTISSSTSSGRLASRVPAHCLTYQFHRHAG